MTIKSDAHMCVTFESPLAHLLRRGRNEGFARGGGLGRTEEEARKRVFPKKIEKEEALYVDLPASLGNRKSMAKNRI